jgi:hypothetical protein
MQKRRSAESLKIAEKSWFSRLKRTFQYLVSVAEECRFVPLMGVSDTH